MTTSPDRIIIKNKKMQGKTNPLNITLLFFYTLMYLYCLFNTPCYTYILFFKNWTRYKSDQVLATRFASFNSVHDSSVLLRIKRHLKATINHWLHNSSGLPVLKYSRTFKTFLCCSYK